MISFQDASTLFYKPFFELIEQARSVHKSHFDVQEIQACVLLSLQTGGCSEDCAYCAQSIHNKTKMPKQAITSIEEVVSAAQKAKDIGGTRFCMGSSGRCPTPQFVETVCQIIKEVKKLGLETCLTMGTLTEQYVQKLKESGLDYYNHNIDTSAEFYKNIITTRTLDERLKTIQIIQKYDINVCCGGILGLGETNEDRIKMLLILTHLKTPPQSVPLNRLIPIPGTPLEKALSVDNFDFIRTVALARILMPQSYLRLSAGRSHMSEEMQALCFFAGINSIFIGDKLLTAENTVHEKDMNLLKKLGMHLK